MEFIEAYDQEGNLVLVSADMLVEYEDEEENEEDKRKPKYNEWIEVEGQYYPARNTKIRSIVEPGYYGVVYSDNKFSCVRQDVDSDELYELPNTIVRDVVAEIKSFCEKAALFAENKVMHKRGVMLCGTPGCGKTGLTNMIAKHVISIGGIVFRIKSINDLNMYIDWIHDYFRVIEPDTPIVTIIEDIDKLAERDESVLSNFLDGDDQFEHNLIIATTNRIHDLNDLMLRPSRFDWIITVKPPDEEVRRFYFDKKGITGDELDNWVKQTEGNSMADLKEVFIAVKLLENDIETTVKKLKDQKKYITTSTFQPERKTVGFFN